MNVNQRRLKAIINIVVSACITAIELEDEEQILRQEIFSKSKKETAVRARTMLAVSLYKYGYTPDTIAKALKVTKQAVSKMFIAHEEYKRLFRAYELTAKSIKHQIEAFRREDDAWLQRVAERIEDEEEI